VAVNSSGPSERPSDEVDDPAPLHPTDRDRGGEIGQASVMSLLRRREGRARPSGDSDGRPRRSLREVTARVAGRRGQAVDRPDPQSTNRRRPQSRLTPRERIALLLDDDSCVELDPFAFAWPSNEVAVMGADAAANIIFRKQIVAALDPEAKRAEMVAEGTNRLMTPYVAADRGLVDDIIDPRATRSMLIPSLGLLRTKRSSLPHRKHGNVPL
jgi:acetyl-CoA carboxylase carboxyltransferase component